MAAKFKAGDIVKLKSGGPDMTIRNSTPEPAPYYYDCLWFAGKKLDDGRFPESSLKSASDD